jgi:hypothetical protein
MDKVVLVFWKDVSCEDAVIIFNFHIVHIVFFPHTVTIENLKPSNLSPDNKSLITFLTT